MADLGWEPDYITVDEYKDWARITDTQDNEAIMLSIAGASRAVDTFCSQNVFRQFGKTTMSESRYYTPRYDSDLMRWVIEIDDLMDLSGVVSLVVEVDTSNSNNYNQTITDFILRPRDAIQRNRPYTQVVVNNTSAYQPTYFVDSARLTADVWGWDAVPDAVKAATYLQANRFHKRRTTPFGASGSTKRATQVTVNLINELDEDLESLLQPYVKQAWTI